MNSVEAGIWHLLDLLASLRCTATSMGAGGLSLGLFAFFSRGSSQDNSSPLAFHGWKSQTP